MRYTRRSLLDPIPEAVLPEGFTIRPVEGEHEAEALAKVHSSAFGSNWKASEYLDAIRSPAFEIDHELVVVAPEGELAAFLVYWIDPVTNSGLFEPVGCGEKFQRQGLTKALMYEAMRRMRTEGVIAALVLHELDNPASTALYASVGFRPVYTLHKYKKQMRAEAGS